MKSRLKFFRSIFLYIFVLSTLVLLGLIYIRYFVSFLEEPPVVTSIVTMYATILTSIITFLGFLVTTFVSLRQEKRDSRDAILSQQQKEIELEKARLELEQLKKQVNKKKK